MPDTGVGPVMIRPGSLKIVSPCPGDADIDEAASFCHTCDKAVHDLAGMTEREAAALLDRFAGRELCVSYRVDRRGEPVFVAEPAPRRLPPIVMALALAACTPWGLEEAPPVDPGQAGECVLVEEGVWECVDETLPEAEELEELEELEGVGCGGAAGGETVSTVMGGIGVVPEGEVLAPPEPEPEPGPVVRVDFEIDPNEQHLRGMVISTKGRPEGERLHYTPTADLIHRWKKKRAAQKAQRKRQRMARGLAKKKG